MKSILIISFSPLHRDPRVKRQVKILKDRYTVTCAGYTDVGEENVEFWPVKLTARRLIEKVKAAVFLIFRMYTKYYWQRREVAALNNYWQDKGCPGFDLVIANDIESLILALEISGGCSVYLDAHEYSPQQRSNLLWKLFTAPYVDWMCRNNLAKTALMSTVSESISREYRGSYGCDSIVIYSAPMYCELEPFRGDGEKIKLVHHGGAQRQRGIEEIINILNYLDKKYVLYLYLVAHDKDSEDSLSELKILSRKYDERVVFKDPVPTEMIAEELNQYDIGVALIQPRNFNYAHCLPNKFFEFIQARLVVASGPTPDMQALIERFDLGIVADDFSSEAMARKIAGLDPDKINRFKQQVDRSAYLLSFQQSGDLLLKSVKRIIGKGGSEC